MNNPFVGFETFAKQRTEDEKHPYGEDSHLDDDSILERHGDVEYEQETDDNYYEPDDYDEDDDIDLQWGKVSDAAKGAVGAAKTGASKAAKTVQSAGQAAGAKVGEAAQTAGYAAQDAGAAIGAGASKAAKTAQTAGQVAGDVAGQWGQQAGQAATGLGQQAAQTATGLGQQAAQTASAGLTAGKETAQAAGQAAGAKVAGAFGKSHDDMMSSLDQAIGFMEKQVGEDDESTGNMTAVRSVERGGFVGEDEEVDPNTQEYSSLIPDLTDDEDSEVRVVPINEAQQEVLTGEQQEAEYIKEIEAAQNKIKAQRMRQRAADNAQRKARREDLAAGGHVTDTVGNAEEEPETIPEVGGRPLVDRTDPSYYAPSAVQNRLEEEARIKRAEQIRRTREKAVATRNAGPTQMATPRREASDEDPFAQSADSVLAKALGSVIDMMEKEHTPTTGLIADIKTLTRNKPRQSEAALVDTSRPSKEEIAESTEQGTAQIRELLRNKAERKAAKLGIIEKQDPRFSCQECGTKVPKGSRKCRKCGSEDIDLA